MIKHKIDKIVIFEGKTYLPQAGFVYLPKRDERYNPVEEPKEELILDEKEELILDEKEELIKIANESGLGSPSTLRRLTIETLKQKIEESK